MKNRQVVMNVASLCLVILTLLLGVHIRGQKMPTKEVILARTPQIEENFLNPGIELWKSLIPYAREDQYTKRWSVSTADGLGSFYELSFGTVEVVNGRKQFIPNVQLYYHSQSGSHRIDKPFSKQFRRFVGQNEEWRRISRKEDRDMLFSWRDSIEHAVIRLYVDTVIKHG